LTQNETSAPEFVSLSGFLPTFSRTSRTTLPDGTVSESTQLLDLASRGWNDSVPARTSVTTPSGRVRTTEHHRARTFVPNTTTVATESWVSSSTGPSLSLASSGFYDRTTRTRTETSPLGRVHEQVLDAQDRVTEVRAPGLAPLRYQYDARGRVSRVWRQSGTTIREQLFGYSDASVGETWAPATATDGDGTTTFDWTSLFQVGSVSRDGQSVAQLTYQSPTIDRVTGVTPPGRSAHANAWAAGDWLSTYTPPALGTPPWSDPRPAVTTYTRDADGKLVRVTLGDSDGNPDIQSAGDRAIAISRDSAGRVGYVEYDGHWVEPEYDASGQLGNIGNDQGVYTSIYRDGPLVSSISTSGPVVGTLSFGYDDLFRPNRVTVAGQDTRYGLDDDGDLECVTFDGSAAADPCTTGLDIELAIARPTSQLTTSIGPTGSRLNTSLVWNELGELVTHSYVRGSTTFFADEVTSRDAIGRILSRVETVENVATTIDYVYDNLGRVTEVRRNGVLSEQYDYDLNGNRTRTRYSGVDFVPPANIAVDGRDRLRQYGTRNYEYNAIGQLTRRTFGSQDATFDYDALGSLRSVAYVGGPTITYTIDSASRRVARSDGTTTRKWLYLDDLRPIAELNATNTLTKLFVYGTGRAPELMIIPAGQPSAGTYRLVTDRLGSVRRVVNVATGVIEQRLDYDTFGRVLNDTAPAFQPFGFAGGLYDPTTKLVRFGARDYDAEIGRWTAPDPIRFEGGQANLYTYVDGDPVNRVDPNGRYWYVVVAVVAVVVIIAAWFEYDLRTQPDIDAQASGLEDPWGGEQDAYRHCLASCRAASRYGEGFAEACGDANEAVNFHRPTPREQAMDFENNRVGRALGSDGEREACGTRCMSALRAGGLDVMNPSEIDEAHRSYER
jgi:RHS repeat-associated protein